MGPTFSPLLAARASAVVLTLSAVCLLHISCCLAQSIELNLYWKTCDVPYCSSCSNGGSRSLLAAAAPMQQCYKFRSQCQTCQTPYQLMGGTCGCPDGFFTDCLQGFDSYYHYTPPKGSTSRMSSAAVAACFNSVAPKLATLPSGQPATNLSCVNCACWADIGGQANTHVSPMHQDHCKGNKGVAANYYCSPCPDGSVATASPLGIITQCTPCPAGTAPNDAKSQCVPASLTLYELAPGALSAPGVTLSTIQTFVTAAGITATAGTYSDGKRNSVGGIPSGLKPTITQLPACKGVSSVEVQQTPSGINSITYYVNYGSQKVLLSSSGSLASAVAATTFDAPAADSLLAGLTGDLRSTSTGAAMVSVKGATWAAPGASSCVTPSRCIKQITAFVQSSRIVGIQADYNTGPSEKMGRQRGSRVTQVLPDCSADATVSMSLCQTAAGGLSGFSITTASSKAFKFGNTACASPVSITASCPSGVKPAITSFGFSTRTDATLNTLLPGPGCTASVIATTPLCISCPAGHRVVAVAGWWDAAAMLVNGLEVSCSSGVALLSGLRVGNTSRVIIPDGDLLSEVRLSQRATSGSQIGAVTKLSLYSSTGKLLGLFGNTASTDSESTIKASKPGQSLTGLCTQVVAGPGLAARMADVTDASYADWSPPLQAALKRISRVTAYYEAGSAAAVIVGYRYTYSDGTSELAGFAAPDSETKAVPAGQMLVQTDSFQDGSGIERIVFTTEKGVPLGFGRPANETTKPKVTVVAPPGEQVQVTPVYGTDGNNRLQGIGAEEVLMMAVLTPSPAVGIPSELQAVYSYGSKPVAGKVVTFTVTDSKTGAVKSYQGTTDANGIARVAVDASNVPAVADVYASAPSSKPDANGPVAATLAPGSSSTITWSKATPGEEALVLSAGPDRVPVGGNITLTATYTVNGTATPGTSVTFKVTLPNGQKLFPTCTTGTRRASARQTSPGTCSVIVSSPVPGNVVATASAPATSGPNGSTTNSESSTVLVVERPPPPPGAEILVLSATPSQVPVGGSITLTASYSVNGTATPGKTVTFAVTLPNGQKLFPTCTTGTRRAAARQTSPGTCSVTVSSPVTGNVVATASVPGVNGTVTSTSSTTPVVATADEQLTMTGSAMAVPVGSSSTLTATYTVDSKPVAGKVVTVEVTMPGGTKQYPKCTTAADGKCSVTVSSPAPGAMTAQGSTPGSSGNLVSSNSIDVVWVAPSSPSPSPITERLAIAATPNQVPVNGSVTLSAEFAVNDKLTAGKVVTFEVIKPDGTKVYPTCTTGASGTCSVTVLSSFPGTMTATATAPGTSGPVPSTSPGADGIATGGHSTTILVTSPQKPNTLTYTVVDPLSVVGDTATVTATLLDPSGKPVPNQPVTFTLRDPATGGKITDYVGMTDAQGVAVVTLPAAVFPGSMLVTTSAPSGTALCRRRAAVSPKQQDPGCSIPGTVSAGGTPTATWVSEGVTLTPGTTQAAGTAVAVSASYLLGGALQAGRPVEFKITNPATGITTTRTAVTDGNGVATLPDLVLSGAGQLQVTASTTGGVGIVTSSTSTYTWTSPPPPPAVLPPVATPDAYSYTPSPGSCTIAFVCNDPVTLSVSTENGVLKNDVDPAGQPLTATLLTNVAMGTLCFKGNAFTYTADPSYTGTDSFTYKVCNTLNLCAQTTVTLSASTPAPNVALLAEWPAGGEVTPPTLFADQADTAGTDCNKKSATALSSVTLASPGAGRCTGPMPAGDYTLSEMSTTLLIFQGWTCYKTNVGSGAPELKTPVGGQLDKYNIPQGESATCVAKYKAYTPPIVNIQVKWPSCVNADGAAPLINVKNFGTRICSVNAPVLENPDIIDPAAGSSCATDIAFGDMQVFTLPCFPTVETPTITCYDVTAGLSTKLTTDGTIPNDGTGKTVSCIVEYGLLGAQCEPGSYQPSNGAACSPCGLDYFCPGKAVCSPQRACPPGMVTQTTSSFEAADCVALKCNPCPDLYPDVAVSADDAGIMWKISQYYDPASGTAGPNSAMQVQCTSIKDSLGTGLNCADITILHTGDVLLNCGTSMYMLSAANWAAGGACVASKLLDYPKDEAFNGLSQGFVSNLVYASSGDSGKVVTFKIVADASSSTSIALKNVAEGTVAGCQGGRETDITAGPDGNVYLWCSGTSSGSTAYRGFKIDVVKSGASAGYLDLSNVQQVNAGLAPAGSDFRAGAFCTARYAVGVSLETPNGGVTDSASNFWDFGVGFSAGAANARALTSFTADRAVCTSGGAVRPSCPRVTMQDFSFLPPIAMSDDYNGVDVSNNPKPVYYFTVLGNDIDPLKTDLNQVVLLDASGATTTSITLDNNVGILTVDAGVLGNPDRVKFESGSGSTGGQTVTFSYKAVNAANVQSKTAATVTLHLVSE